MRPLSHRKDALRQVLQDWGVEAGEGLEAQFLPLVVPTVVVDDASAYTQRLWPSFMGNGTQGAVAAVYSAVGLFAATRPIHVVLADIIPGASNVGMLLTRTDIRTANQGGGVFGVGAGTLRGLGAFTAQLLTGTHVTAGLSGVRIYDSGATHWVRSRVGERSIELDVGEYLWFHNETVNIALSAMVLGYECLYRYQAPRVPALT